MAASNISTAQKATRTPMPTYNFNNDRKTKHLPWDMQHVNN
jgi:hypothetical protein